MPSLKMKTKSSTGAVKEKYGLHVCLKSSVISKHSCSHVRISQQTAEFDACSKNFHDVSTSMGVSTLGFNCDEEIEQQELVEEEKSLVQSSIFFDCTAIGRMESSHTCSSNLETIFSPMLEPVEVFSELNINCDAGSNKGPSLMGLGPDDGDDNRSSRDFQTCNVSDFFISDMIFAGLPIDGNDDANTEFNPFPDYKCAEPNMLLDVVDEYMMLPFLEDTAKSDNTNDDKSHEVAAAEPDNGSLYLAINQMKSVNQDSDVNANSDQAEHFDPQLLIKYPPELLDLSNFPPTTLTKETQRRKSVTLVLDLDETLVHSTLEHCDAADFTFTVFLNMKEHTVYVKQRPYLKIFLEMAAEMFEVVIFTASQSIYAAQLLDILDPDGKLISRRVYRESCIFSDGSYTKDLTILGVDLAKIAIIDNSPQVFKLQMNNGIPIKSWFDDPSDCALISLLPFLEILADAEDVRPIIANRFGLICRLCSFSACGKKIAAAVAVLLAAGPDVAADAAQPADVAIDVADKTAVVAKAVVAEAVMAAVADENIASGTVAAGVAAVEEAANVTALVVAEKIAAVDNSNIATFDYNLYHSADAHAAHYFVWIMRHLCLRINPG